MKILVNYPNKSQEQIFVGIVGILCYIFKLNKYME